MRMATAVTVKLSIPQIDTASMMVVAMVITNAGNTAAIGEISGRPPITHNASQVNRKQATKKPIDPSSVRR